MFATIKSLIPEPRQADQPRRYVGRHRQPEQTNPVPGGPISSAPISSARVSSAPAPVEAPEGETAAV